ncbi:Receptor-like kinase [Quillaja saponaria]|uniref:Receptor-like kinase n=1 Tax=Quillaja saponaria TaxID=32244 RepID=A0AAD7Q338_QUISA|nr:Receptor-like kinase [Quillaja saponaria]
MGSTQIVVLAATVSFFVVTLLFAVIILACSRKKKPSQRTRPPTRTRPVTKPELSSVSVDQSFSFEPSVAISMAELSTATKNFSPDLIVGDGSFGLVYKARLSNNVAVAIKKLDPDAFQGFREFRAEMETLGKLRHRNIVKILGYCSSGSDRLLVYEFIERGSLDYWLHDSSSVECIDVSFSRLPLTWDTRNKIIRGVANGLSYLHGLDKPIIHRDIKTSNVLLDSEFEAHIADFGLARTIDNSSHVSTQVAGTMGYMPPEYREGMTVATVKADVYSFGILMLETATGHRPNLPLVVEGKDVGLVEWAKTMVALNAQMQMVDPSISRDERLQEDSVKEYFRIACMCTNESPKHRPVMVEIVEMLNRIPAWQGDDNCGSCLV